MVFKKTDYIIFAICIVLFFFLLTLFTNVQIRDLDIWLHLKTGELIVNNHSIPKQDIYSCAYFGARWIDHEWLFQVIAYLAYHKAGAFGLLLMQTTVVAVTFLIFMFMGYKLREYLFYLLPLILCLMVYRMRFSIRPEMFSVLFFSVYLLIIYNHLDTKWYPFLLAVIQVIWVNMHGFFFLGPLLMLLAAVSLVIKRRIKLPWEWDNTNQLSDSLYKRLLGTTAILILFCLINPYFIEGALYPFKVMLSLTKSNLFFNYVVELRTPIAVSSIFKLWQVSYLGYYIALIILSALILVLNYKKLDIFNIIIWVFFVIFSLASMRNIAYFAFAACLVIFVNLNQLISASRKVIKFLEQKKAYAVRWTVNGLIIFFLINTSGELVGQEYYLFDKDIVRRPLGGFSEIDYPKAAVDFLINNNIRGNIFNEFNSGSYIIGRCSPSIRVYIDGRTEVYGHNFFKKYLDIIHGDTDLFDKEIDKYNINAVLLNSIFFEMPKPLLKYLYQSPKWKLVYFDEFSCVFLKQIKEYKDIIKNYRIDLSKWASHEFSLEKIGKREVIPYPYINRAYTLHGFGFKSQAIEELNNALKINPASSQAYNLLGLIYFEEKSFESALKNFYSAVEFDKRSVEAMSNLAATFAEMGDYARALDISQKAIKIDRYYPRAYYNLGSIYMKEDQYAKAAIYYHKAIKLELKNKQYLSSLGEALFKDKDYAHAEKIFRRALDLGLNSAADYNNLGICLYKLKDFKEAEKLFLTALSLDSDFAPAYNHLGILCAQTTRLDEADSYWKKGLKLDPDNTDIKNNLKRLKEIRQGNR